MRGMHKSYWFVSVVSCSSGAKLETNGIPFNLRLARTSSFI